MGIAQSNKFNLINFAHFDATSKNNTVQTVGGHKYSTNEMNFCTVPMEEIKRVIGGRKITNMTVYVYINDSSTIRMHSLDDKYDPATVNWNNKPRMREYWIMDGRGAGASWISRTIENVLGEYNRLGLIHNGIHFQVASNVTMYTPNSAYKPYVILYSNDPVFGIQDEYPQSGFINEKTANEFGWSVWSQTSNQTLGSVVQQSAKFRWRAKGAGTYKEITVAGTANKLIVPANTFNAPIIEWQVAAVVQGGIESPPSQWRELSTVDAESKPVALYPKSLPVDGERPITFSWRHDIATGTSQTKFELQTSSNNGGTWVTKASGPGSAQSYQAPANAFAAGQMAWRVRTGNSDGVMGAWSEPASFLVRASPKASIVAVDSKPRPTLQWQADSQQGYRVTAGDYDSGVLYGTKKSFRVPVYLPDGSVELSVQVTNSFGMTSNRATARAVIQNRAGLAITLATQGVDSGARLSWTTEGEYTKYYILRDGEPIAKTTATAYTDWLAGGKHRYRVRGITAADDYTDSAEAAEISRTRGAAISALESIAWLPLEVKLGGPPTRDQTSDMDVVLRYYCGSSFPVAESAGQRARVHTMAYTLLHSAGHDALQALVGRTVVYKHREDTPVIGLLGGVSTAYVYGCCDVTFTITELAKEGMAYDA